MGILGFTVSIILTPIRILMQYLAKFSLQVMGWKTDTRTLKYINANPRCVAIALHTSNWDAIIGMMFQLAYAFPSIYVIKQSWIDTPVAGAILTHLGFIGIDEDKKGQTTCIINGLRKYNSFVFIIMPEGQRVYTNSWKSGYYHIAKELQINILPFIMDYADHRLIMADLVTVGDRSLEDVAKECQQKLVVASIPLYPDHAYPAPRCHTHYRACGNAVVQTSAVDWRSMSLLYLLPGVVTYGLLLPIIGLWLIYCRYGAPGIHK